MQLEEPNRHIQLEGQANFRDLGGYQTVDGRTIKWGQVYRSGRLAKLGDADLALFADLGIRTVVTLLTTADKAAYGPDLLPAGAREVALPIDSDTATKLSNRATAALRSGDFSQIPRKLNPEIHRLLVHDGRSSYAALLRLIADPANLLLVFHCSQRVHRTGTGAAILLAAMGVPWEIIRADYLLSNHYRHQEVQYRLEQLRQQAAARKGITPEAVDMTNMVAFLIQDGSYIDASLDEVQMEFGSMDTYLQEGLGIDQEELARIRDVILI